MSSNSKEQVRTSSTNVAQDRRTVVENGQAIVDSLIEANDDAVVAAALKPTLAAWQSMASTNNLNLIEVVSMGSKLIDQINKSQVKISDSADQILRDGMKSFEGLLASNTLNVELVEGIADRAFDTADRAVDIVADVKTADFADLSKAIMLFAVVAMGITAYTLKGK